MNSLQFVLWLSHSAQMLLSFKFVFEPIRYWKNNLFFYQMIYSLF